MKNTIILLTTFLMLACATGYQSSDDSVTGGYTETRLAPDEWRVLVEGNGFTTREEAEQILMRRAAELTLEQGKRYFVLTAHRAWLNAKWSGHHVVTAPADQAIVTALSESDARAFDAVTIVQETNEVAGGRLSKAAKETLAGL
jgi:hypothetical protein